MTSSIRTLCFCFLACFLKQTLSEEPQKLRREPGDDVTLQCHSSSSADIKLLMWIRSDLKTDEGYVYFSRRRTFNEDEQHPYFVHRVTLKDPRMQDGDVSVILRNINVTDSGTYECHVGYGGQPELISTIDLTVTHTSYTDPHQITVKTGQDVPLHCVYPRGGNIELLVWMRQEDDVLTWKHGKMFENFQHETFKNRVKLMDPQMNNGDVSVILKNITINDTGKSMCRVKNNNRSGEPPQLITFINLMVMESSITGGGGDKDGGDKDGGDKDGGEKDGLNLGLFVGAVLLLPLLVAVGYLIYRKRIKKLNLDQRPADEDVEEPLQNGVELDSLGMEKTKQG